MVGRILLFFFISTCFSSQVWVTNDINGVWLISDKDAHVKIFPSYGKYYGEVVWMKFPIDTTTGKPTLDKYNKDPKLRSRPIMNMLVLQNLEFDEDDQEWSGGTIYNPKSGNTYDVSIKMKDRNTFVARFYMTIRSLGQDFVWERVIK